MRTRSLLLFVASFHFAFSDDSDEDDRWIVPTEPGPSNNFGANLVWSEGSTATLEWTSTLENYVIDLYQQGLDPPSGSRVDTVFTTSDGSGSNQFKWTVQTYDSNTTFSPVYFFWLNPSAQGKTSHYFNITDASSSSSAASVPSTTSSKVVVVESTRTEEMSASKTSTSETSNSPTAEASKTSTLDTRSNSASDPISASARRTDPATTLATTSRQDSSITPDSTPTNPPTPSDTASAPGTTTTTTDQTSFKVGLGVGLGLGIPLFLLIGVWVSSRLWRQWRTGFRKQNSSVSLAEMNDTKHDPYRYANNNNDEAYYQHRDYRHEMSSEPQRYEVSGMGRKPSELPG